jgi:hypothetical protein
MDPFIEGCGLWEDFHTGLIGEIHRALAEAVPERYMVRIGERPYIVLEGPQGKEKYSFLPDVAVREVFPPGTSPEATATALAETEEVDLRAFIEVEYRESFLEIYDSEPAQRLVTCLEVLSPSNKRPNTPGWDLYQRKRQGLLLSEVNLVEFDLLRGGQRLPMLDPWPDSPYTFLVARSGGRGRCRVRAAYSLRPLPLVLVPLARPDPDVPLNLQPLIETLYMRSRYKRSIDYHRPLTPPLTAEENAWLAQWLGNPAAFPSGK